MIVSGLLTGILASRVVSGIIGEYLGWRFIFFVAAGMMVICVIIIMRVLPDMPCNFKGRYSDLMKSLFSLVMEYPSCVFLPTCRNCFRLISCSMDFIGI